MPRAPAQSRLPAIARRLRVALLACCCLAGPALAGVVVIGHPGVARMDEGLLQRIYTGRVIEVDGSHVVPVNAPAGSQLRQRFLALLLGQDEEKYTAYWTVRRYIGKGSPPRELASAADIIQFVSATPGAIGYIDDADLRPGLTVLLRK